MRGFDTLWGSKINTSVYVNGLYAPANSLGEMLCNYSAPGLFASEEYPEFNPSKSGSATKIRLGNRFFAVTTRHQLSIQGREYEEFCLVGTSNQSLMTSHTAFFELDENIGEIDLVFFEFTEVVSCGKVSPFGWYSLDAEWNSPRLEKPTLVVGIGYPSYRNVIDYTATEYGAAPNAIWGREEKPSICGRLAFKPTDTLDFSPKGMSGGPVFGLKFEGDRPSVFFAGVLTEASRSKVHFSSRTRILNVLKKLLQR
ncbi:hypothetical protein PXK30_08350 [Phaeobacter gallaeciensis]|uniref:hypothetical protein n=1 Tax=Phaeobacter gallaeciensis TaxID=60890 RepID=UPI00237EF652|nr:hypothetical protein [Phaeobacter gallaeciensis]MDE4303257.1 hypothetical protein [Phaeobacter gallaeciensis]MDE4307649.1 hypothetical protein [Phaeobacter gallaeciensis]MDE4312107.1 hypothetical protein [Phaeobacter gallaeciensis]MDE4316388.1 hypothetical protein [Phaeobacter gallaeciensis]MDE4321041.1 hypothetical protein [Phaeobacter gallaeciensis]